MAASYRARARERGTKAARAYTQVKTSANRPTFTVTQDTSKGWELYSPHESRMEETNKEKRKRKKQPSHLSGRGDNPSISQATPPPPFASPQRGAPEASDVMERRCRNAALYHKSLAQAAFVSLRAHCTHARRSCQAACQPLRSPAASLSSSSSCSARSPQYI